MLPHTIDSIRDAMSYISGKTGEIIVVDNDSSDLTAEVAKAKKCRVVNESFRQIAKARNTGAKEAIGRYLFFVDADTVVPKKILQEAISKMEKSNIGGGGALLEFDHDHGRFFRANYFQNYGIFYLNALNYLPVVLFFAGRIILTKPVDFREPFCGGRNYLC